MTDEDGEAGAVADAEAPAAVPLRTGRADPARRVATAEPAPCTPASKPRHGRGLRAVGITVGSPIDVPTATFRIERGCTLLHGDRDFDAFEDLRGLRGWRH